MADLNHYYAVLGLAANANVLDVKKAFREKAKLYHPDISTHPNAEEKFIEVTEAYEQLVALLTGKQLKNPARNYTQNTTTPPSPHHARKYSASGPPPKNHQTKMRYEDFVNSDFYKFSMVYSLLIKLFATTLALAIILGACIGLAYEAGLAGFIGGLIISAPLWLVFYMAKMSISWVNIKEAMKIILQSKETVIVLLAIANLLLLVYLFQKTIFIPWMAILFVLGLVLSVFAYFKVVVKKEQGPAKIGLLWTPLLLNIFLLINYVFSGPKYSEKYHFYLEYDAYIKNSELVKENTGWLYLDNLAYHEAFWLRYFTDTDEIHGDTITYYFSDGCLGPKVLKGYCFVECVDLPKKPQ